MLPCPKCHYDNELGRIFCHQCGVKLDLDQIKPVSRGGKSLKRKPPGMVFRKIAGLCGWLTVILLLFVIVQMLRVPDMPPLTRAQESLSSFTLKRGRLETSIARKRAVTIMMTEAELNAFGESLGFNKTAKNNGLVEPSDIQIRLSEGAIQLTVLGRIRLGGLGEKAISIRLTGQPFIQGGQFLVKPFSVEIGRLLLPTAVWKKTGLVPSYFGKVFRNLSEEKKLLEQLTSLSVGTRQVTIEYQPPTLGK